MAEFPSKAKVVIVGVGGIVGAEVQCDDPASVAARWSEIAQLPLERAGEAYVLTLDNASVRFVECTDARPEGLGGIDVVANDMDAILEAAEARGKRSGSSQVMLCGMRVNLVAAGKS